MPQPDSRRMSASFMGSFSRGHSPVVATVALPLDEEEFIQDWQNIYARDIVDSRIVFVGAETSVEDACEMLLSEDILCLAVRSVEPDASGTHELLGLFDFADVNAFLTLAATRHTFSPEDLKDKPRVAQIENAARAGKVPVRLVSDLSEKNPLTILRNDSSIVSLLEIFARGTHRVIIRAEDPSTDFVGIVSDRGLLAWFSSYCEKSESFLQFTANSLQHLGLPSLNLDTSVITSRSSDSVLDVMKLMSDQGVSSIAVIDEDTGGLLSAVSVTDIGKVVVPSQTKQVLSMPLKQFVSLIKDQVGSTDGADRSPIYVVYPTSSLMYTMQKILATNAHRVFVTIDAPGSISPSLSNTSQGGLCGIVSIVDTLSLFARLARVPGVDPKRMQRRRRASSASSASSRSDWSRSPSQPSSRRTSLLLIPQGSRLNQW